MKSLHGVTALALLSALAACGGENGLSQTEGDLTQISSTEGRFTDIPFYFSVPESGYADVPGLGALNAPFIRVSVKDYENDPIGLRMVVYKDGNASTRGAVTQELGKNGVLEAGDIVLSYRPEWANTLPYPHIQMGTSHAGIIFTSGGKTYNLDMPLDQDYNNTNLTGQLNSKHYEETPELHIVRPRDFGDQKKENLNSWVSAARDNYSSIRSAGLLKFNADYLTPRYAALQTTTRATVTKLGKILLGDDTTSTNLTMYCSEFAWHLLSLSSCTPEQIADAGAEASCVKEAFTPMGALANGSVPGLAEGPLRLLNHIDASTEEKLNLVTDVFSKFDAAQLSSGHAAASAAVEPLIKALKPYYQLTVKGGGTVSYQGQNINAQQIAGLVNSKVPANYSPTAFLVNTFLPENAAERKFDYVTTVVFTTDAGLARAKQVEATSPGR